MKISAEASRKIKLSRQMKISKQNGGFGIEILYPGKAVGLKDSGLGTIGRIDHANITSGTLIPMHPHRDDEILTYLRSGRVKHKDSEGHTDEISNSRIMLMNADHLFTTRNYLCLRVDSSRDCKYSSVRKQAAYLHEWSSILFPKRLA